MKSVLLLILISVSCFAQSNTTKFKMWASKKNYTLSKGDTIGFYIDNSQKASPDGTLWNIIIYAPGKNLSKLMGWLRVCSNNCNGQISPIMYGYFIWPDSSGTFKLISDNYSIVAAFNGYELYSDTFHVTINTPTVNGLENEQNYPEPDENVYIYNQQSQHVYSGAWSGFEGKGFFIVVSSNKKRKVFLR